MLPAAQTGIVSRAVWQGAFLRLFWPEMRGRAESCSLPYDS